MAGQKDSHSVAAWTEGKLWVLCLLPLHLGHGQPRDCTAEGPLGDAGHQPDIGSTTLGTVL